MTPQPPLTPPSLPLTPLPGAYASICALQVPYLCYKGHAYLFVPRKAVLDRTGLGAYWHLMWPGFMMVVSEWWVLEALVFLSGALKQPSTTLAAFAIVSNLQALSPQLAPTAPASNSRNTRHQPSPPSPS